MIFLSLESKILTTISCRYLRRTCLISIIIIVNWYVTWYLVKYYLSYHFIWNTGAYTFSNVRFLFKRKIIAEESKNKPVDLISTTEHDDVPSWR